MGRIVEIPNHVYARLQAIGSHLFSVSEVIERLAMSLPTSSSDDSPARAVTESSGARLDLMRMRSPRERGVTVELAGQRIHAGTVGDLYEQVFRLLLKNGQAEALKALVPYRTSNQRYLIALEPRHPNGNAFFVPVRVGPYHIEAHKNYETALKQLAELLGKLGLEFRYLR